MPCRLRSIHFWTYVATGFLLIACRDDDSGPPFPYGMFDERNLACLNDLIGETQEYHAEADPAPFLGRIQSTLGRDSFVVYAEDSRPGRNEHFAWSTRASASSTYSPTDPKLSSPSMGIIRFDPDGEVLGLARIQFGIPAAGGSISSTPGELLELGLQTETPYPVYTRQPYADYLANGSSDTSNTGGVDIRITRVCPGSHIVLTPMPGGGHSFVLRDYEIVPTATDTTYSGTFDFDLELYGGLDLPEQPLRWRGIMQFTFVEDVDRDD